MHSLHGIKSTSYDQIVLLLSLLFSVMMSCLQLLISLKVYAVIKTVNGLDKLPQLFGCYMFVPNLQYLTKFVCLIAPACD